jgi:hypothetical protein
VSSFSLLHVLKISNDDNVAKTSVEKFEEYAKMIYHKYDSNPKEMTFADEDKVAYDSAKVWHICEHVFITRENCPNDMIYDMLEYNTKDRDHCHITDRYHRAARKSCNLNCKIPEFCPVVFIIW